MKLVIIKYFIFTTIVAFAATGVIAQSATGSPEKQRPSRSEHQERGLFRELGLTKEQNDKIREMLKTGREEVLNAQKKLREAGKALDAAIYADVLNEQMIELRITERDQAQAAVNRLKTMRELDLRKILTPEQLMKFREIREKYARQQDEMKQRRGAREKDAPHKRQERRDQP